MTIFTVHIPVGARDPQDIADKLRLIPEKASFGAFILGPIWLALRGAYGAAAIFALANLALASAVIFLDLSGPGFAALFALVQLFISLEGPQMARVAASKGRMAMVDVVNAASLEEAESIALRRLIGARSPEHARPAAPTYMRDGDLPGIGLFPGAGG